MFTVLFALLAIAVFVLTLAFTKLNFKKAFLNAVLTILMGVMIDIIIGSYFIGLAHLTL